MEDVFRSGTWNRLSLVVKTMASGSSRSRSSISETLNGSESAESSYVGLDGT